MDKLWYVIGALAFLVTIAVIVRGGEESVIAAVSATPEPTIEETVPPTPTPRPVTRPRAPVKTPAASTVPTTDQIAEQFAGNRIQFDIYCQAFPVENTFNDGTQVMLDNRSPDDRVVTIGGVQHTIDGYGWNVMTMTSELLPTTWAIDCGTAKNVGKIVIDLPYVASPSEPLVSVSPGVSPTASASPSITPAP